MACTFGVGVPRIPAGCCFSRNTLNGNSFWSSSHGDNNLVLASSLGKGGGGVHGYRSRKVRRRRSRGRNDSQDELEKQANEDGKSSRNGNSHVSQVKRVRRRPTRQEQQDTSSSAVASESEEVAPVAVTVLTAPELFETPSTHQSSSVVLQEEQAPPEPETNEKDGEHEHATDGEAEKTSPTAADVVEQVKQVVAQVGHKVVDDVLPEQVVVQAGQVAQAVEQVALPVVEKVVKVAGLLSPEQDVELESDDEFEAYKTSDRLEFRGIRGLENITILQENYGLVSLIYDFYLYMLKKPVAEFALAMFAAPVALSMLFTLLYLPQTQGLAFGEAASYFDHSSGEGLRLSWETIFQVFMFSISLSTGLQPVLAPVKPYTLVVANINALVAQLLFVFLSGAVFARLSQPSQPIRCSTVAIVSPVMSRKGRASPFRVFMARYVLVGPPPCELVDVKVDLSYKYNTITRAGTYFRATESLKLIRSEVAYLNHGMLVRHIIDETSPLNKRTPEMLKKEDGIFTLSVVGLERSSMQPVFHVQHYSITDDQVVWNADFEDMILISRKNKRIVDHSRLSQWRPL